MAVEDDIARLYQRQDRQADDLTAERLAREKGDDAITARLDQERKSASDRVRTALWAGVVALIPTALGVLAYLYTQAQHLH